MPPMNVHADDKAKWIVAGVNLSFRRYGKVRARIVTMNAIEDFAFVEHDFTQAVLAYVMLKLVEVLGFHRRECPRKRVRFKRHHGFSHRLFSDKGLLVLLTNLLANQLHKSSPRSAMVSR